MRFSNQIVFLASFLLYAFVHGQIVTDSLHDGGSLPSKRKVSIASDEATRKLQSEKALDRGIFDSEVDGSSDTTNSARVKRTLYLNSHAAPVKSRTTQVSVQQESKPQIFIIKQIPENPSSDQDESRNIFVVYRPKTNNTQKSQTTSPSSILANSRLRLGKIKDNISLSLFKNGTFDRFGRGLRSKYLDTLNSDNAGYEPLPSLSRILERRKDADFLRHRLLSERINERDVYRKSIEQVGEPTRPTTTTTTTYRPITLKRRWREPRNILDFASTKRPRYE